MAPPPVVVRVAPMTLMPTKLPAAVPAVLACKLMFPSDVLMLAPVLTAMFLVAVRLMPPVAAALASMVLLAVMVVSSAIDTPAAPVVSSGRPSVVVALVPPLSLNDAAWSNPVPVLSVSEMTSMFVREMAPLRTLFWLLVSKVTLSPVALLPLTVMDVTPAKVSLLPAVPSSVVPAEAFTLKSLAAVLWLWMVRVSLFVPLQVSTSAPLLKALVTAGASRSSSTSRVGRKRRGAGASRGGLGGACGRNGRGPRDGWSWEIFSHRGLVRDTMGGQRSGRADRAPGRCRAGEGVAWRHYPTGRLVSTA